MSIEKVGKPILVGVGPAQHAENARELGTRQGLVIEVAGNLPGVVQLKPVDPGAPGRR